LRLALVSPRICCEDSSQGAEKAAKETMKESGSCYVLTGKAGGGKLVTLIAGYRTVKNLND
jgi:hypothetical protein